MTTPRVFIIRHGETEWSLNGRHTGTSDIPLTANGEKRIKATGHALVGDDRLIVPANIAHIYVSPRHRAQRTLELLNIGCKEPYPWTPRATDAPTAPSPHSTSAKIEVTEAVREWDYGAYEGLTSATIRAQRKEAGLGPWNIWRDGAPEGESREQIMERLDGLIREIREKYHSPAIKAEKGDKVPGDVLVIAHGHILRAFAARWVARDIDDNPNLIMEAGGVGTLSYEHHNVEEPAILLGGAFMADLVSNAESQ